MKIHHKNLVFAFVLGLVGCQNFNVNSTYYLGTTSVNYNPSYNTYDVKLNNRLIGGALGSMNTSAVTTGLQNVTWKDAKTGESHAAKNQVFLNKKDIVGQKYLVVHLYPDDTIEIVTSLNWPIPTQKGLKWRSELYEQQKLLKK
ncbi:hypothetical protein [Acinetobacter shaoyimingii]|uniref:Uncharacterized protein n=1 Tax=Acinetobacter shaoyimingii TaxID=2715164 RepID=A0A6G8RY57_9GAMM|nr:hypothetical protein [Acinetobacter shaoyimingii]NHB57553.1 hypothetical protein [Acinetobacter shaoyimingii]QIO06738.1 hypothetical protein G8E00_12685 [Acinetobacter shaoyimingii]